MHYVDTETKITNQYVTLKIQHVLYIIICIKHEILYLFYKH